MEEIFKELIITYIPKEITNIVKKIRAGKILWENVGKRRNNLATINIGTDPDAGVTKRITNAIDAVLEKEWKNQGEPEGFHSPRNAVKNWLGIEDGKLSKIKSARDKKLTIYKTTRIWGETKGKATTTDRIVILSNVNPFENNQRLNGKSVLQYELIKESTKHFMGNLIDV